MKASEVLRRYNDGRRDFSGESLRGESFKGKNLAGADFSEADIRGANFTNAYLKGSKFCGAKAGLQLRWTIGLISVSLVLSAMSGALSVFAGGYLGFLLVSPNFFNVMVGLSLILGFVILFIIIVCHGLRIALVALATFLVLNLAGSLFVAGYGDGNGAGMFAFAIIGALAGTITGALVETVAFELAGAFAFTGTLMMALVGAFAFARFGKGAVVEARFEAFAFACLVVGLYAYISWRALAGDEKYALIRTIAVAFAAIGGTSFRHANLTNADFSQAKLKSTDFRRANITRTCWRNTEKLDHIRPGTTYLQDRKVRQLLITGQGQDQNFDRQNLRGINLQGANLADSRFISTDLNEATLQEADLSRTKLIQTQLDEADLTGATLTGATIEDWGITSHTQLQGVRCQYVFMRLPTKDNPNQRRKPDNWNEEFEDGDFAEFIKPIVDTLDLYHNQGVDPRAIAISFKQLAENNPDAGLGIVAMEKRGKDKFLLRAATALDADHSKLNAEYFTTYNEIKALAETEVQALLAEKDSRISSLENMVQTALQRPSFYAENFHNQGDNMPDKSSDISISNVTGSKISGVAGGESTAVAGENLTGVAGGDISGTVTNTINQLTESESPEAPTLADLLKQLKTAIESQESGLSEKDKKKALKHLDTIGKLGVELNNSNLQEMAENALDALPTILKRGAGLMEFIKTHFNIELDEILDNIQDVFNF